MLTTPISSPGRLVAFADHERDDFRYVVAARPRLRTGADGEPDIQLVTWRAASGDRDVVGGRLNLGLTLAVTDTMLREAGLNAVTTAPVPWLDAEVQIEGQGFSGSPAPVALTTPDQATVAIDLDAHSTGVLASLLERETVSPVQVIWTGHTRLRLPDVSVTASASRVEIERRIGESRAGHSRELVRSLIEANVAIDIRAGPDPELENALRDFALEALLRRFETESDLVVSVGAADVVAWPVRLAATLDDLGTPSDSRVSSIVLSERELGRPSRLEVRVLGDFDGALERVDVEIAQGDSTRAVAFTAPQPQSVALDYKAYRWRFRARWGRQPAGEWSAWHAAGPSSSLLIPVTLRAAELIEVTAVGIAFGDRWQSIDVQLIVSPDSEANPSVTLTAERTTAYFELDPDGAGAAVRANVRYLGATGLSVDRTIGLGADENLLLIRDPYSQHSLRVSVIPAGNGWDDVAMTMVDLRYRDGEETWEQALSLSSHDDFAEWRIPLRDGGPRIYEWRYHASFRNGRFEESEWQDADDQLLAVVLVAPERRELQILPVFLREGESVEVRIRIGAESWKASLRDKKPHVMRLPSGPYRWQAVWRGGEGTPVEGPVQDDDRDVIVLPAMPANS